jgi:hypothetical protein
MLPSSSTAQSWTWSVTDAIRSGSDSLIIAETPCAEPSRLYSIAVTSPSKVDH